MKDLLDYLIAPVQRNTFFEEYYEKKPLIVQRADYTYYDPVITAEDIVAGFDKNQIIAYRRTDARASNYGRSGIENIGIQEPGYLFS